MGEIVLTMKTWKKHFANFGDECGAAALEFGIVGPVFMLFMIGSMYTTRSAARPPSATISAT
jgi:Flp pilus assembly protein TadG